MEVRCSAPGYAARVRRIRPPSGDSPFVSGKGASGGTRTLAPPLRSRLLSPSTAPAPSRCDSRWNRADRSLMPGRRRSRLRRGLRRDRARRAAALLLGGACPHALWSAIQRPSPARGRRGGTSRSPRGAPRLPGTRARDVVTAHRPAPHRVARAARGRLVSGAARRSAAPEEGSVSQVEIRVELPEEVAALLGGTAAGRGGRGPARHRPRPAAPGEAQSGLGRPRAGAHPPRRHRADGGARRPLRPVERRRTPARYRHGAGGRVAAGAPGAER